MMKSRLIILVFVLGTCTQIQAQEFPKGWVLYVQATQGLNTRFSSAPDVYIGSVQLVPQVTLVPNFLRISATAAGAYTDKKLSGVYGPGVTIKLATLRFQQIGSIANLQVQLQHLWGTEKQQLIGGGLYAELGQALLVGGNVYRDYNLNSWWFQSAIGFNLLWKKKPHNPDPFIH